MQDYPVLSKNPIKTQRELEYTNHTSWFQSIWQNDSNEEIVVLVYGQVYRSME
jgi:hypothetical protein